MGLSKGVKSRSGRSRKTVYLKTNNIDKHANIDPKKLRDMLTGECRLFSICVFILIALGLSSQDRVTLLGEQMNGFEAPGDLKDGGYELTVPAGEEGGLSSNAGGDYALSQDVLAEINEYV
jgi:hypothetical protein